jgi:hypothetical protein
MIYLLGFIIDFQFFFHSVNFTRGRPYSLLEKVAIIQGITQDYFNLKLIYNINSIKQI